MKKIKGKLSKPEPFTLIAAAALSLCALLPLRVYQVTTLIDPETGFFTADSFTIPLFYAVLAVVCVAVLLLSFLSEKANRTRSIHAKNRSLGIISAITALTVMFDAVIQVTEFVSINAGYDANALMSHAQYLSKSGATALLFEAIFGFLAGVFFWIYTISCFTKELKMPGFQILSISPVAWEICRIIVRFVRKISFVNVSDLLLELFMIVFMITFLMAFAQIVTKVTPEVAAWRLYGCGVPAALIAFLVCVPRLFLMVIGHSDSIVEGHPLQLCDFALALFIPVFLHSTALAKKQESTEK